MSIKISVCLITKNEEKYIEGCLKSLLPVADEIIILDTGSTDRTLEICQGFVGTEQCSVPTKPEIKIFQTTWENDFSKARNKSISYATRDWILYIDADEILTPETQLILKPFLEQLENDYQNIPLVVRLSLLLPQRESETVTSFLRCSLFKNNSGIHFIKPIHEELKAETRFKIIDCPSLKIYHLGSLRDDNELDKKSQKYISQLENIISQKLDVQNNFYYFQQLGFTYSQIGNHQKALISFYNGMADYNNKCLPKNNGFYGSMLSQLIAELLFNSGKPDEAPQYIFELEQISPTFPDTAFYTGFYYQSKDQISKAIIYYNKAFDLLNTNENPLGITSLGTTLFYRLNLECGKCHIENGDELLAINYFEKAFKISGGAIPALFQLIKFHTIDNNLEKALPYYFRFNFNISEQKKKHMQSISTLSPQDIEYKNCQLKILTEIINSDYFSFKEKEEIKNKINTLK